ncbi:MAG: DNA-3-methyladenine glycosylase I [Deltaproteobacteria bacterium]|nr:DNA-3-methyladenine glycosylase I [Deltaproteobacteria bacterium]
MSERARCPWAGEDPLNIRYHDTEWGVPVHDDRRLFELLVLEGAQAGLSWLTVLRKREAYRAAYRGFDPELVARFGARDRRRLLGDEGIVRNRAKIESSIKNANALLELAAEEGSFSKWLWSFVDGKPVKNQFRKQSDVPAQSPLAVAISKELKRRGFSFVGPTIVYAFLEAVGVVDDHLQSCFKRAGAGRPRARSIATRR